MRTTRDIWRKQGAMDDDVLLAPLLVQIAKIDGQQQAAQPPGKRMSLANDRIAKLQRQQVADAATTREIQRKMRD